MHLPEVRNILAASRSREETAHDTASEDQENGRRKRKSPAYQRATLRNELAVLGRAAHMDPYTPGESVEGYLDKAEEALRVRSDNFTALLNRKQQQLIDAIGADAFNRLKKTHHNLAVEELVLNTASNRFYVEAHHRIYPKIGTIYFDPESPAGRAPFYSHAKKLGSYQFSTFTFNLLMLGIFGLLVIILIFAEFPGRFLEKGNRY